MKKRFSRGRVLGILCVFMFSTSYALSQTITLTAPLTRVEFEDGDEFSCNVPGVPWDMDQIRDIPFDYNFQQPTVSDGIWRATNSAVGAAFYPLFRGYSQTTYTNYPSYYTGGMPYGPLNPIDCSRYDQLSIRMGLPQSARSSIWLAWTDNPNNVETAATGPSLGFIDGDCLWDGNYQKNADGFRIYDIAFTQDGFFRERCTYINSFDLLGGSQPWSGTNYGFFIQATLEGAVGTSYEVDWIRLYNSAESPVLNVTWSTVDIPTNYSGASDNKYSVQLWLDSDASGYDGDLFATGLINDGSYDLYTAALPPGDYYIYLRAVFRGGVAYETLATSGYSARITILAPPSLEFSAPSYTSGVEYAASVLGSPWDMSSDSCFNWFLSTNFSNYAFGGGLFSAYADPPLPGYNESDVQLMLNTSSSGAYVPIDSTDFRYLTYTIAVDPTGYTNINDRVARGWVARFIWGKTGLEVDGTEAQGIPILEDWHSYTLDLWDHGLYETENPWPAQIGWKESETVNWIRFDPLEVPQSTLFYIEDIKLCAENAPVNNLYNIQWKVEDSDSEEVTIDLYYGSLPTADFSGNLITTLTQAPGSGSYVWNLSGISDGDYYIKAVISDGSNSVSRISMVPIVKGAGGSIASQLAGGVPAVEDFDGDGIDDVVVFKESTGYWMIIYSSDGSSASAKWGASGYMSAPADFDGDGKADLTVYCESGDWPGYWYILRSSDFNMSYTKWGDEKYLPVSGDFDSDGTPDLAVYCSAGDWPGYWYILRSTDYTMSYAKFGDTGYTPVPGDYDGDGVLDLAVYCESGEWPGYWYVLNSSDYSVSSMQFGAAGYVPVPGDYDGDGKTDIAVFCESGDIPGYWFVWQSASSSMFYAPFGTSGYVAAQGDYDGDGKTDMGVYNPTLGNWYAMSLDYRPLVWLE